ncbi:MAG: cellulose biosynthesis protein BcsS [Sulfuricaulis sp.]|nr:cellulose biosynthesis protein BcsS [Sulfuricaulis sp.]
MFWPGAAKIVVVASVLFTLAGLVLPNYSHARQWIGLTGIELAEKHNAYGFAGAITPLAPDAEFGQGWVQSYWLDWVEYRFGSDGEEVRARAPGFSASLGYQQSNSKGFWAAYAGAGYRKTTLTPDRLNAEVRGSQSALLLMAEMDRRVAMSWRFVGAVQLAAGPDTYWTRAKFLHATSASVWYGMEIIFQGDPDYHATKVGLVLDEWPVGERVSANFKLGANKTKGIKTGAYAGIEFVGSFRSSK